MNAKIIVGDALAVLRTLESESVQCVVTSPPYWGLRDYGCAGQLGLESTPAEYIAKMVEVFREVKRVLRSDGTCWVNMGSSYASGDTGPTQSRQRQSVLACGNDDKEQYDYLGLDSSYPDLCDGCRDALLIRTVGTFQPHEPIGQLPVKKARDSERLDSATVATVAALPSVPVSTNQGSSSPQSVMCSHCANCGACLLVLGSSSRDAQLCVRKSAYIADTAPRVGTSVDRKMGMGPSSKAYSTITFPQFKPKDLVPMPWMLAMAMQADGWYLRSDVIWAKPNPMPESVTDRPTKSHEYIFLLTKSERYFYDAEAIKEENSSPEQLVHNLKYAKPYDVYDRRAGETGQPGNVNNVGIHSRPGLIGRNKRTVWTVATQPFPEAHFATFSEELITPCILAGTSEKGCCAACGAPWQRLVDVEYENPGNRTTNGPRSIEHKHTISAGYEVRLERRASTVGWEPTCKCAAAVVPCVVADPFAGSGTTGVVALRYHRSFIGIELNTEYAAMAERRIRQDAPLFNQIEEPVCTPSPPSTQNLKLPKSTLAGPLSITP